MAHFTLILALLCTFSWISVSVSEFHTVEVQPGEDITLHCSNFSTFPANIHWLKLQNGPNVSYISSMSSANSKALFGGAFKNGKFNMTSNTTTLFLHVKSVDLSDFGLYFCGHYNGENSIIFSATHLKVQEVFDGFTNLMAVILGGLTVLLVMIISLVVIIWKFHKAQQKGHNQQHSENLSSDSLNYAAVNFCPEAQSSRRPAAVRELETHVVYAATR
ncbi:uncharacterized protein LOC114450947 [Parambassis ranga]|uniref:Uncharacterized protein LOC114450947 n=1 Tax=Parambassis ranga TaxID=210632 RepID=A0A6P7K7D3_9TELE|nr:uncharacterized protein LOC114450947 [Parambassis ranga]XP_028285212.1 uncharacterized protein LOC114450947 [Parambassis ranga]XP_028285214.1 uncharacterized protein LOC114450947 [Parambassis ranga]